MLRIGIDLGGTKIAGVALEETGAEVARARMATPRGDYAGTMETIAALVAELERQAGGAATVGIGMPGALSLRTGLVKNANSTWLNGMPFDRDLAAALATLDRHRERLARSLAVVINLLDPDIIVIGGGVSQMAGLYGPMPDLLASWCFSDGVVTPVVPALHGDDSGVRGAAWLWPKQR